MGRKGVSKRKKAKEKKAATPDPSGSIAALTGRKPGYQPELVVENVKPSTKGKKKR